MLTFGAIGLGLGLLAGVIALIGITLVSLRPLGWVLLALIVLYLASQL